MCAFHELTSVCISANTAHSLFRQKAADGGKWGPIKSLKSGDEVTSVGCYSVTSLPSVMM